MKPHKVAIIGGGILGILCALKLSFSDQVEVTLFEATEIGSGLTKESGGMIRLFHEHRRLRDLAHESLIDYQNLSNIFPDSFTWNQSLCIFSKTQRDVLESHLRQIRGNYRELSSSIELLQTGEARERFGTIYTSNDELVLLEKKAGRVKGLQFAQEVVSHLGNRIEVKELEKVEEVQISQNIAQGISSSKGSYFFDSVILANNKGALELDVNFHESSLLSKKAIHLSTFEANRVEPELKPNLFDYQNIGYGFQLGNRIYGGIAENKRNISESAARNKKCQEYFEKRFQTELQLKESKKFLDLYFGNRFGLYGRLKAYNNVFAALGFGGGAMKFAPAIATRLTNQVLNQFNIEAKAGEAYL